MAEKKILAQAAVSIAAIIALILFVEWKTVAEEFTWYPAVYWIPVEVLIVLTSFAFLSSLKRALQKWFIDPIIRWVGKGT